MLEISRRIQIEEILNQAIEDGLTNKAAALVFCKGKVWQEHFGESKPELEYDLASLTKILCATYLAARAVSENKLDLEEKPWVNWPGVSIKNILLHDSGLPAWREVSSIEENLAILPEREPGKKTVYSDIGFIALGDLLEKRFGQKLNELFNFPSLHYFGSERVDDANCQRLGGVAGHAGLFGTLNGVFEFSKELLIAIRNGSHSGLDSESRKRLDGYKPQYQVRGDKESFITAIRYFAQYLGPRALGFDKQSPGGSTAGVLSDSAIGHLGYTGTSLWLDPKTDSIYILLMHRLDKEGAKAIQIMKVRQDFHKQAACLFSS